MQPLALVVDLGEAHEGWDVLTAVVRAEQQLSTGVEAGAHVGLGAAAVATVRRGQGRCQCGVHVGLLGSLGSCSVFGAHHRGGWRALQQSSTADASRRAGCAPCGAASCPDRDLAGDARAVGRSDRASGGRLAGARCACRGPSHPATTLPNVPTTAAKKAATTKSASEYTAHHLQVLEGLEAVRKRPGMYIGSTDSRGLMHCLWEIIDNAVDEALGGHCDRIEVTLHHDGSVEVRDNGRGIPVDIEPRTGLTGVEVVFTQAARGRQVRRRLLHGIRRAARRRRLGRQRAVLAPRRRGRPRAARPTR